MRNFVRSFIALSCVGVFLASSYSSCRAEYDGGAGDLISGYYCTMADQQPCAKAHYALVKQLYRRAWNNFVQAQKNKSCGNACKNLQASTQEFVGAACKFKGEYDDSCAAAFYIQRIVDLESLTEKTYAFPDTAYGQHLNEMIRREGNNTGFSHIFGKQFHCNGNLPQASLTWRGVQKFCAASCSDVDECLAALQNTQAEYTTRLLNPPAQEFTDGTGNVEDARLHEWTDRRASEMAALDKYRDMYCGLVAAHHNDVPNIREFCEAGVNASFLDLDSSPF